jgi:hypothetical protein
MRRDRTGGGGSGFVRKETTPVVGQVGCIDGSGARWVDFGKEIRTRKGKLMGW